MPDGPTPARLPHTITFPKFSFVKFGPEVADDECCQDSTRFCLPFFAINDLKFQLKITTTTASDATYIMGMPLSHFHLLIFDGIANTDLGDSLYDFSGDAIYFTRVQTGIHEITLMWTNAMTGIFDNGRIEQCNQCFQFGIYIDGFLNDGDNDLIFSNCFVRICDDCWTSKLEYSNDDDFADFRYCNMERFANVVRLPIYLSQPQFPDDETIYIKSNGKRVVLKSNVVKEYQAQTEHFPEAMHDKLKVALSHDSNIITGQKYSGDFRKSSPYEIEWTDTLCLAPAKFRAFVNPDVSRNSNCQSCKAFDFNCPTLKNLVISIETDYEHSTQYLTINWDPLPLSVTSVTFQFRIHGGSGAWTDFAGSAIGPRVISRDFGIWDMKIITQGECLTVTAGAIQVGVTGENTCDTIGEITSGDIGPTIATMAWAPDLVLPPLGYDWTLHPGPDASTTAIQSGTYSGIPGSHIYLTGLSPSTQYTFRMRAHCSTYEWSVASLCTFNTIS